MKKHYVTFFSPGTFVSEQTTKEIDSWDVAAARKMAKKITERYSAKPYGFQFSTDERKSTDWEPKEIKRSGMYYLGGEVMTIEQVKAKNDPDDRILILNMEGNGYKKIITASPKDNWKWTHPFEKGDVRLEPLP